MVYGVRSDNSISSLGFALKIPAGEKAALPVAPASVIYSHFKHVSGFPAPEGTKGVTISKLNILDVLIEQMNRINKPAARPDAGATDKQLDTAIEFFSAQIQNASDAKAEAPYTAAPYKPAPLPETGLLFSFSV